MKQQVLDFIEMNKIMKDYFSLYVINDGIINGKIYENFIERFAVVGKGINIDLFNKTAINTIEAASKLKDFKKTKSLVSEDDEKIFFDIKDKDETYYAINKVANIDMAVHKMGLKFFDKEGFRNKCLNMDGYIELSNDSIFLLMNKIPVEMMIEGHYVVITGYTLCPAVNEHSKIYIKYLKDISIENGDDSKYYFVIKEEIYKDFKKATRGVTHMLDVYTIMACGPLVEV